ncbi:MAG: hypothetical protein V4703_12880 [Actinomycetota bacterium]
MTLLLMLGGAGHQDPFGVLEGAAGAHTPGSRGSASAGDGHVTGRCGDGTLGQRAVFEGVSTAAVID